MLKQIAQRKENLNLFSNILRSWTSMGCTPSIAKGAIYRYMSLTMKTVKKKSLSNTLFNLVVLADSVYGLVGLVSGDVPREFAE